MKIHTYTDVLEAQRKIHPYLKPTPLHSYPAMNELLGTEVYIKDDWTPEKIGEYVISTLP